MVQTRHALLLVEDSCDDEALSLRAIENCGVPCTVRVARHGQEAVDALLAGGGPSPDLIVLDFHLPGLDGLEVLRRLRQDERTRHVPVVILSALADDQQLRDCLDEGADSFVEKPLDPEEYTEQVAMIVRYWFTADKNPHP